MIDASYANYSIQNIQLERFQLRIWYQNHIDKFFLVLAPFPYNCLEAAEVCNYNQV